MRPLALLLMSALPASIACSGGAGGEQDWASVPRIAATGPRAAERERMVTDQIEARGVRDPLVLNAMRAVARHEFVPAAWERHAYDDTPLDIGMEQTISQPFIVASMTEAGRVRPGDRVLEIGTGSGYQAAVLAEITEHVYTIEIIDELAATAERRLVRMGYDSVRCRSGDGYAGWPEAAPFDVIIVTAAPDAPPPALVKQLRPGGRMIIPLERGAAAQALVRLTKGEDGTVSSEALYPVSFVPFTRAAAEPANAAIALRSEGQSLVGTAAPEWTEDGWLTGGPLTLDDLRGRVVLVRFFTNTCPFCAASMPALERLHERYRESGLTVVGFYHPKPFGTARSDASVRTLLDEWGVTFPIALDTRWSTLRRYWLDSGQRRATSASFLLDGDGVIRYLHPGPELHPEREKCNLDATECARHYRELEHAIRVLTGELPPR